MMLFVCIVRGLFFAMNKAFAYIQILVGTAIAAAGINLFMLPNHLPSGGLGGLLVILHYVWGLPIGSIYFLLNLPVLAWLFRLHGWSGVIKTVWGIGAFSLFMEICRPLAAVAPTSSLMLAAIMSGVTIGLGLGLVIRVGGSTGGTSSLAYVVKHYTGMDVTRFLLITDLLILGLGAVVLSLEAVLYGLVTTYLVIQSIEKVQNGLGAARCLMIITEEPDLVSRAILTEVRRGVTRLEGQGEYSGQPRPVLMCVVSETETHRVKHLVLGADPNAFVVVTNAQDVSGPGFTLDTSARRIPFWATQRGL